MSTRAEKLARAERMVTVLETFLESGAGVTQVSIDGSYVQMDRNQALKELEHWEKQVARYSRTKSRTTTIRLNNSSE